MKRLETVVTMMSKTAVIAVCAALALAGACAKSSGPAPVADVASPSGMQPAASHAATPATAPAAAPDTNSVEGTVVETMDASNYTYVRVKTATGEIWAATSTFKVAVGEKVIVPLENPMQNFKSTNLKREFPLIYFVGHISRPGEAVATAPTDVTPTTPEGPMEEPTLIEKIAAAPGGTTVANIVTNRKTMAGKTVTVRGKVMKFNGGILGSNWIHIQDGSGAIKDGTHDILATSNAVAKVGDIVTITGQVAIDKDFGAGYSYAVLLQNATVTVK